MSQKQVKIIGLSIVEGFGAIKATELKFDPNLKLIMVKGEVGSGKSTLNKSMRLTTQGSDTLIDKNLYGGDINMVAQLLDGDKKIFVGCKGDEGKSISYFLYELDQNGKKVKDPIIDGVKATPAAYLKSLQTSLTWRLSELTSENPTVQRNILLELYSNELEKKSVVFDKKSPNYVGGVVDKIEKAKEERSYLDMKRKEVGGIADDLKKKGVDFKERMAVTSVESISEEILKLKGDKSNLLENPKREKENNMLRYKNEGLEIVAKLKSINDAIIKRNSEKNLQKTNYENDLKSYQESIKKAKEHLLDVAKKEIHLTVFEENFDKFVEKNTEPPIEPTVDLEKELSFNENGSCTSKPADFDGEIKKLLEDYISAGSNYLKEKKKDLVNVNTSELDSKIEEKETQKRNLESRNLDAIAVNSYHDWKDANTKVNDLNKKFFMLLSGIDTGVEGLHIAPEYELDEKGERIAKGNDIYLMYDGSYDPKYFSNPDKELRKLSSYSDTQKPMICLLIQKYLLSKKPKALPYLWIDQVPIDKKTKTLLDKMSEELGLWLFVNWTGDFDRESLKDGEILIENGEIFQK